MVLLIGWGVFLYRGLVPGSLVAADDFRVVYSSSRAWLYGVNPYEASRLDQIWSVARGESEHRPSIRGSRDLLYPPPTFVLVAPVAAFDWPVAREAWAQVNLGALGVSIIGVVTLLRMRWQQPSTWLFVGAAIAFAPCITGMKVGQTSLVLTALVVSGQALRVGGWPMAGGVLLGLAAVLKPQIGLVFLAYEVFRGRWRVAGPALAVAVVVAAIGIGRLEAADVPWVESLRANVAAFTTGQGDGNPLPENEHRYQMIDLRPIFHTVTSNRTLGAIGAFGVAGVLAFAALLVWLRKKEDSRELLALSIGATASLMIVYHRFYDASVLLLPLGWVIWALATPAGRVFGWTRWAVLVGILPFFVPGAVVFYRMAENGGLPDWLGRSLLWEILLVHHQAWALVWLTGALVLALSRCPVRESPALPWLERLVARVRGGTVAERGARAAASSAPAREGPVGGGSGGPG